MESATMTVERERIISIATTILLMLSADERAEVTRRIGIGIVPPIRRDLRCDRCGEISSEDHVGCPHCGTPDAMPGISDILAVFADGRPHRVPDVVATLEATMKVREPCSDRVKIFLSKLQKAGRLERVSTGTYRMPR